MIAYDKLLSLRKQDKVTQQKIQIINKKPI